MDLSHWIKPHARFAPGAVAIRFEHREIADEKLARSIRRAASEVAATMQGRT